MIDPTTITETIKNYGSTVLGGISLAGVATVIGVVIKTKKAIDDYKAKMQVLLAKKDKAVEDSQNSVKSVVEQNKVLVSKIDNLTNDVYRLESEVRSDVKGNRKN